MLILCQPQTPIAAVQDVRQDQGGSGPERRLEGVHRVETRHAEIDRGDESREPCQALGDAAAAELAGEERHQHYGGAGGESGKQVDRQERVAQSRPNPAEQDER
jgi:hypothetical protein